MFFIRDYNLFVGDNFSMSLEYDVTTVDIFLTEENSELYEDLVEIVDNPIFHISENDRELIKEMMAYLIAKDYVVKFGPEENIGYH